MTDTVSHIPLEIVDAVLDLLCDDVDALRASSLVHRSWVPRTRYYLFNSTIISQFRSHQGLKDNATGFIALCRSPHCTILPCIEVAIIHIQRLPLVKEVIDVLSRAPALRKVTFVGYSPEGTVPVGLAKKLSNIKDFVFDTFYDAGKGVTELVTSFPLLQSLAIYTRESAAPMLLPAIPTAIPPQPLAHLRTLRLRLCNVELLLKWLLANHPPRALETLDLCIYSYHHREWDSGVSDLNNFIHRHAGSLKHLSIGVRNTWKTSGAVISSEATLDLNPLSNLRSLSFRTHDIRSICASLATLSAESSIHILTIDVLDWELRDGFCDCVYTNELSRLFHAVQDNGALTKTLLDLRVSEPFVEVATKTFEPLFESNKVSVSIVDRDGYQLDTFDSESRRIMKRSGMS